MCRFVCECNFFFPETGTWKCSFRVIWHLYVLFFNKEKLFQSGFIILHCHQQWINDPGSLHSGQHLVFSLFFVLVIVIYKKSLLVELFIYTFLMTSDVRHHFICLYYLNIYCEISLYIFCLFSSWIVDFFTAQFLEFLYILYIIPCQIHVLQILSPLL